MRLPRVPLLILLLAPAMPAADYAPAISRLETVVRREMEDWGIGGIAVALVDGRETVCAKGFGEAEDSSLFRVGSISKLFNALAVMQQVERGNLDLDAAIDPGLLPSNPYPDAPAITLRHLLSHRSGLQRESATGGYFDAGEPTLAATVASLRDGVLATAPGAVTRYSNIAPSLAGHLVEKAGGMEFAAYQQRHLHAPLGMDGAAWRLADLPAGALVPAHMRVADGRGGWTRRNAPVFDLGTLPAGNLYASAGDLARFASALLAGGGGIVSPESLAEMWKPQFSDEGVFGLGFVVGKFRTHRMVSHGGAVYGFSASLVVLPEAGVAAIVLANEDIAGGPVARIRTEALSLLLEVKLGETRPEATAPFKVEADDVAAYAGSYVSESYWAELSVEEGELTGEISGQPTRFIPTARHAFLADSRIEAAQPVVFTVGADGGATTGFTMGNQRFRRVPEAPAPLPRAWRAYLGSYGPDFIPLVISERDGQLYAMTENMVDYRLTPLNRHVFALPPGMYINEHLVFLADAAGHAPRVDFCNMILERTTP